MSSTLGRVYSIAAALVVFFVAWALVAAKPWVSTKPTTDKRLVALDQRQRRLRAESIAVRKLLAHRWAAYRVALAKREHEIVTVRQLWAEEQAAAARAAAARPVYSTYAPVATRATTAAGRTMTTVRTVVAPSRSTSTQSRPATPSSSPAPAAPASTTQPSAPPPPPQPSAPPPPPVVSTPPATNTKSS